jgi:hypothetical protein
MANSFILPVKKGNSWSVNLYFGTTNEVDPNVSFYWIPISVGNAADTFEKIANPKPKHRAAPKAAMVIADLEPEYRAAPILAPEPEHRAAPTIAMNEVSPDESVITEFVNVLKDVLQNPAQENRRERLTEAVRKLFNAAR